MAGREQVSKNIKRYVFPYSSMQVSWSEKFLMLPVDFFQDETVMSLNPAELKFYLACCANKETQQMQSCLRHTLTTYRNLLELDLTDEDIKFYSYPQKRLRPDHDYFVSIPVF